MERWAIGVDLGGTKIAAGAVGETGRMAGRITVPTRPDIPPAETMAHIAELVRRVLADTGISKQDIAGIGLGVPGPLDPQTSVIQFAPNLGWHQVAVIPAMEAAFPGIPIRVENDANAAALGEHRFGAGRGFGDMVYVTVSTGVGGGLILNNRLYAGATGGAGEIGHLTVVQSGPICGCGRSGCLEALSSGTAIARQARERVMEGEKSELAEIPEEEIDAAAVGRAAFNGDTVARAVLDTAFTWLGRGLAVLVNILNPGVIVIGGGVSALWSFMEPHLQRELQAGCVPGYLNALQIRRAELGSNVGVYGAAALFFSENTLP